MIPVSRAFLRTIEGSHQPVFKAVLTDSWQTGTAPTGTALQVLDGGFTVDGEADIRTTGTLTVPGSMWPNAAQPELFPYGNEIYVGRGVAYSDDLVEIPGLGYLRIREPDQQDAATGGPLVLNLEDRMQAIVDGRLETPLQFASGDTVGTFFATLVQEIYPLAVVEFDDDSDLATLGRDVVVESDRFGPLKDVADSLGKLFYFDHRGIPVVVSAPDPTRAVARVAAGRKGTLVRASRKISRSGVRNAVVARGDGTDQLEPVYAVAYDNDPDSPTYYFGDFGKVPEYYASPMLTTTAQCQSAADAMVRRKLGLAYSVDMSMSPNPALRPFDPVWLDYSNSPPELHLLRSVSIPFRPGPAMGAQTREQTRVVVGMAS